jgi:hypothetical protein
MSRPFWRSSLTIAAMSAAVGCSGNDGTAPPTASAIALVSGDHQTGTVGQALAQPLVVRVTDKNGASVSGVGVSWAITAGGGGVSVASVTTDAQGHASVTWTLGPSAGSNNNSAQASAQGLSGSPVTFAASGSTASTAVVYTDTAAFRQATAGLGTPAVVTFEDADSTPINNTIAGRTPFDGTHYAGQGFTFASPGGYALYIAPGGLFWNASNSLAIGHFPFDTTHAAPLNDPDSLAVTMSPGCSAVSLQLVDNGSQSPIEFVLFLDANGATIKQAPLPANYSGERAFIGLVSSTPVAKILVAENANDGDDVDYDDFTCFHP